MWRRSGVAERDVTAVGGPANSTRVELGDTGASEPTKAAMSQGLSIRPRLHIERPAQAIPSGLGRVQ